MANPRWMLACALVLAGNAAAQSSDPHLEFTLPTQGARVPISSPFVITWKAANLPDHPMLSLRLLYSTHDINATINGQPQANPTATSSLITSLLTDADTRTLFATMKVALPPSVSVLESGTYTWDLPAYCPKNTMNGKSICQPGRTFQLEAILRDRNDPCADNHQCRTPRPYFMSVVSPGVFTFAE